MKKKIPLKFVMKYKDFILIYPLTENECILILVTHQWTISAFLKENDFYFHMLFFLRNDYN